MLRDKECESVALCGLGGAGKSEIALSFAHWVKDTMPDHSVLWMSALSSGSIDKSYGDIAHKIGLDCSEGLGVKTALQRYLSSGIASPWFLIIDNADDEAMLKDMLHDSDGSSVLPRDDGCFTLFTTRSWDVAQCVSQGNVIDVEAMNKDDAKNLLARLIDKNASSEPDEMVDILLEKLTCLPLAIAHAAAYMKRNRKSTSDYVNLMAGTDENLIKLLQQRMATGKATASVLTTWAISFEQINMHHPQAATLLSFCSQIEPKDIPRTMLPDFTNEIELDQAIGTLLSYAFIRDRGDMRQTFDMHSLVHLAAGVWLREMKGSKAATEAVVIRLDQLLPESLEEIVEEWWAYLPHACKLLMSIDMVEVYLTVKAWKVGFYVVCFLYWDCRYHESAQIVESVLELCERWWDKDGPVIMLTRKLLIKSLSELGLRQRKRAVEIAELVLGQTRRSCRTDPADEIKAELNLIWAYLSADQKNEASDRAATLAERLRKFDVHDHTWVLQSKVNLGSILLNTEKHNECIDMLEGALAHHDETGHHDKIQLLKVKQQLASAYNAAGQPSKAIELLERILGEELTASCQVLTQLQLLKIRSALGTAYMRNGRFDDAIQTFTAVVEETEGSLGLTGQQFHQQRFHLNVKESLAMAYALEGQLVNAIKLSQELEATERVIAKRRGIQDEDEELLLRKGALAAMYLAAGRSTEGKTLINHMVEGLRRSLGESHSRTVSAQDLLAKYERVAAKIGRVGGIERITKV
ncbi:hypothetical protein K456DRAFT_1185475 [Colletotrichum gloeosporioides 23]|nr:hypothetical protein K456DRAFT_1185475 [Colletotrichum gloeosporioides 23]